MVLLYFRLLKCSFRSSFLRCSAPIETRAQLFEGRLALNPGLNLTRVSFSFVQKHFLGQFYVIFIEHRIINLLTKRIKLNLLYKLSYLNSNFALTLGYLNPALDNPAQHSTSPEWARYHVKIRFCCTALLYKLCETIKLLN